MDLKLIGLRKKKKKKQAQNYKTYEPNTKHS